MDHLKEFCLDLEIGEGVPEIEPSTHRLTLNDTLAIDIKTLEPAGYSFYSPIAPCPKVKKEMLFIFLMKANLFGQGTMGSTIGLAPEESLLTLSLSMPYDVNYREFRGALEDFANVVDFWRLQIEQHKEDAESGIL